MILTAQNDRLSERQSQNT